MIGSHFIIGFRGPRLSDETRRWISENQIGGVILFNRNGNIESPEQVHALTQDVRSLCNSAPFIGVDQEGGRVQRLKAPLTEIPSARDLAQFASPSELFDVSAGMARELKAVGINLNFAPVADVRVRKDETALQDRAFSQDAATVARCVTAFVRGHLKEGVLPCVKHFPGHGDATLDSHLGLPLVETDLDTLRSREWLPFSRAIKADCPLVMTAHILNSNLDSLLPATFSEPTLNRYLRQELRFRGVIVTDDLEMGGALERLSVEEIPTQALKAGCDLLLYRSEDSARLALTSVQRALESEQLDSQILLESQKRISTVRATLTQSERSLGSLPDHSLTKLISEIRKRKSAPPGTSASGSHWVEQ